MWMKKCVPTHTLLEQVIAAEKKGSAPPSEYAKTFCKSDLTSKVMSKPEEIIEKREFAQMRTCYLNCTLWVLLPMSNLRWKMQQLALEWKKQKEAQAEKN